MPLTILTKSSILDVKLGCKIAKSFNKSFCEFNIFSFTSHLVKYLFSFYFIDFCFYQYSQTIFKLCCRRLSFMQTSIFVKTYTRMQFSCCRQDKAMLWDNLKRNLHHFNMKKLSMFNFFTLKWKRIKSSFFCKIHGYFNMIIYLKIILKSSSILAFRREGQQIHNTEDLFVQNDKTLPYQTTRNVL